MMFIPARPNQMFTLNFNIQIESKIADQDIFIYFLQLDRMCNGFTEMIKNFQFVLALIFVLLLLEIITICSE